MISKIDPALGLEPTAAELAEFDDECEDCGKFVEDCECGAFAICGDCNGSGENPSGGPGGCVICRGFGEVRRWG